MKRLLAVLAALLMAATVLCLIATAPAAEANPVQVRLRAAIRNLPVAAEDRTGYDRSKFRMWIDANGDCQDTRDEVLDAESLVNASGCDIQTGRWFSYYDHQTFTQFSGLDIDHLVPLAEAWDSGARGWNAATRTRYANDLRDPRALVAVSASANRSKGDQDPAEWQPTYGKCRYVTQWVAVKIRWSLTVDRAEKRALASRAAGCRNVVLTVTKAKIGTATTNGGDSGGGTGGTTSNDPRFSTCIEAKAHGYGPYYQGVDPEYDWYTDADRDGIVCE